MATLQMNAGVNSATANGKKVKDNVQAGVVVLAPLLLSLLSWLQLGHCLPLLLIPSVPEDIKETENARDLLCTIAPPDPRKGWSFLSFPLPRYRSLPRR